MKITVLKYGESVFNENYIFRGGRENVLLPITFTFYLIETNEKRILVDVGCDDGAGFDMSLFKKPVQVLADYDLKPFDITDVVITHAHHDHIASVSAYKNATIHIQETEYLDDGKEYIPETYRVHTFESEFQLTDKIVARKIGGHRNGSSIVICYADDKKYVLCGDECYVKACFDKQIPTGSSYHPEISEHFIKEYSETDCVPLLFHDPNILKGKIGYEVILHTEN